MEVDFFKWTICKYFLKIAFENDFNYSKEDCELHCLTFSSVLGKKCVPSVLKVCARALSPIVAGKAIEQLWLQFKCPALPQIT